MSRKSNCPGIRLLSLVLSLVAVLIFALPAAAAPTADSSTYVRTSAVYYGPYDSSTPIGRLNTGTCITVLGAYNDYYKIDCSGMSGYINKTQVVQKDDGNYYVRSYPIAQESSFQKRPSLADALSQRSAILSMAQQQLGTPYVYGGMYPGGFDCSGFVYYVYGKCGIDLHRCADEQMQDGIIVSRDNLQIGDLVFFSDGSYALATHVGIYVGDGMFIHASTSRGICYSSLDNYSYSSIFLGARRIINTAAGSTVDVAASATSAADYTQRAALPGISLRTVN